MTTPETGHATNTFRISFQSLFEIAVFALTITLGVWASTGGIRSDLRMVLERQDAEKAVRVEQAKLVDERAAATREAIASLQRRVELQQYEVQQLKEMILGLQKGK